jgi:hypothetical protein
LLAGGGRRLRRPCHLPAPGVCTGSCRPFAVGASTASGGGVIAMVRTTGGPGEGVDMLDESALPACRVDGGDRWRLRLRSGSDATSGAVRVVALPMVQCRICASTVRPDDRMAPRQRRVPL